MFFKKKIDVDHYCSGALGALFDPERDFDLQRLRQDINDPVLNAVDEKLYFDHVRAIVILFMDYAIKKRCRPDVYVAAEQAVRAYLERHRRADLGPLSPLGKKYREAFYEPTNLGIGCVAISFSQQLTDSKLQATTISRLSAEFEALLKSSLNDFKYIKLTTMR